MLTNRPPANLQVMVATHAALGVVTLRGQGSTPLEIHTKAGLYYGITWDHARYYFVARGAPTNMLTLSKGVHGLGAWRDFTNPVARASGPRGDGAHQVHYNGRLWVTDTLKHGLLYWDPEPGLWGRPVTWPTPAPNRHLNSVWGSRRALWVVEHTKTHPYKYLRLLAPGVVTGDLENTLTLTLHRPELTQGPLQTGLHNIYTEGTSVYTLGPAHMLRYDLVAQGLEVIPLEEVQPKVHYLRGLARVADPAGGEADYFIIGRSNAENRPDRGYGSSALLVYNTDWRLLARYDLPAQWGQIMEVRALTYADRAHNGLLPPNVRKGAKWGIKTWEP